MADIEIKWTLASKRGFDEVSKIAAPVSHLPKLCATHLLSARQSFYQLLLILIAQCATHMTLDTVVLSCSLVQENVPNESQMFRHHDKCRSRDVKKEMKKNDDDGMMDEGGRC